MPEAEPDAIIIHELELSARIGVPDEERRIPQRLIVSFTLWLPRRFDQIKGDLAQTVDYAAVACDVKEFVSAREDKLLETLADALAAHLLGKYPLRRVRLELRKFVLADTAYVAAVCERESR
ncbi:MAG: dihydroneopterin aldolase [Verrucomicrobiaceae bacterium]|nr:dihydroneopterin aldolase [Verrucomicrobiaceae bacterium]